MTTPERLSADPAAEAPLSADELSRLAGQVYAQLSGVVLGSPSPQRASTPRPPETPVAGIDATAGWPGGAEAAAVAATAALAYPRPVALPEFTGFSVPDVSGALGTTYGDRVEAPRGAAIPRGDTTFDVASLRRDFPILSERVNGHPLVWLDNAATTHKPEAVIERIAHFYRHENSNIHRAAHELAARATEAYEEARETVRRFIGASRTEEIVFVRGATEAINLVAWSWGAKHIGEGDEIVITHLEHHANIVPWQQLAQRRRAVLKVAPVDDSGTLLLEELERLVGPRTRLVAATQVSNALGTVTPVREIVEIAHRHGARVLVDGAQSVPHTAVDVRETGADFFVFSGHKVFGPTGIGVLYGREDALAETPPWQSGGNMIADVTHERSIFQGPRTSSRRARATSPTRWASAPRCATSRRSASTGSPSGSTACSSTSRRAWRRSPV